MATAGTFGSLLRDSDDEADLVYTNLVPSATLSETVSLLQSSSAALNYSQHMSNDESQDLDDSNISDTRHNVHGMSASVNLDSSSVNENDYNVLFGNDSDNSDDDTFNGFSASDVDDDYEENEAISSGSDIELDENVESSSESEADANSLGTHNSDSDGDSDNDFLTDQQIKDYIPQWLAVTQNAKPFTVIPFNRYSGPIFPPGFDTATAQPCQYFSLFFTDEILDEIVTNTNNYAVWLQRTQNKTDPCWNAIDIDDLKAFIALTIIFAINRLTSYKLYWSPDEFLGNIGVKSVMLRKKYELINKYLHVSDRENEPLRNTPQFDKLYKVRKFLEDLTENFRLRNAANCNQSIDEGMVAFKGRLSYVQYMPLKVNNINSKGKIIKKNYFLPISGKNEKSGNLNLWLAA
jgi:hypothetical protein